MLGVRDTFHTFAEGARRHCSGCTLRIAMGGPAATVAAGGAPAGDAAVGRTVGSIAVDDLVADGVIEKVDFVNHLWQLPRFLASLRLGYRFALGHFTMHDEETVLYAWVPGRGRDRSATIAGGWSRRG